MPESDASDGVVVTLDDLRVVARLAGLPLDESELEALLPLYQYLRQRVDGLHAADLPLGAPAVTFPADWQR